VAKNELDWSELLQKKSLSEDEELCKAANTPKYGFRDITTPKSHVPTNSGLTTEDHNSYEVIHEGKNIGKVTIGHEGPHNIAMKPKYKHHEDAAHAAAQEHHKKLNRRNDYNQ